MKISVIVCTYNRCQSLAKALQDIAASKIPGSVEWEVLVVDNNSNDQTRQVVQEFCLRYPGRFRYIFEARQGLSHARNTGIREAQGDILAFTDDDVILDPMWLQNLTASLHDGSWAGAGGRIVPVWPGPLPRWLSTDDPHTMGPFVAFDLGTEAVALTRPPYGANMAFRREAFESFGNFRTDLGPRPGSEIRRDDIEFGNRLLAAGKQLRYEPSAVVHHPAPAHRLNQKFVLRWWYWFGRGEIVDLGLPRAKWRLSGVPFSWFRRLVRWTLEWLITTGAARRFACKRNVWYIAGNIMGCFQLRRQGRQAMDARVETNP